jgi:hypothetical protein
MSKTVRRSKLSKKEREDIKSKIRQLLESGVKSSTQIAKAVGVTPTTALNMIKEIKLESKLSRSAETVSAKEAEEDYEEKSDTESEKFISGTKVEVPLSGVSEKITLDPDILMYFGYTNERLEEKGLEPMNLSDFINKAIREYFRKKGIKLAFVHDVR